MRPVVPVPFVAVLLAAEAFGAAGWIRISSPHFELFTDAGEKKGRDTIAHFEQMRSFFDRASPVDKPTDFPVRLLLFRDNRSYAPYRVNPVASAYFTSSPSRDYVVMGHTDSPVFRVALHEYMHLMLRHSGLKLPVWLNEGWADVYSTLRPAAGGTAVGDMIEGRVQVLSRDRWLSLEELESVTQGSPVYKESNRAGIFYAESWALVHMLYLSPDYKDGFSKFVNAVHRGQSTREACQTAWGKSSDHVFADLQHYLNRKTLFGAVFAAKLDRLVADAVVTVLSHGETELMRGELLAAIGKLREAQEVLQRMAADENSHSSHLQAEVMESLGYVAWARGDTETARADFQSAMDLGGRNPKMFFHLATLERGANHPLARSESALERAVTLKPDYMEARLELGLVLLAEGQHGKALMQLLSIRSVDADHAARLFNALAYAYAQEGNLESARHNVQKAQQWAQTDSDRKRSAEILDWIASRK